jgi:flavin-dependent dehydrogenase
MPAPFDAIVVGAGPAGSAASITLAGRGCRTLLLEKDVFPRRKVCGAYLAANALPALKRLDAEAAVLRLEPERIERGSVHLASGVSADFTLPAPGLGISRFALDDLLARRAAEAGAEIRFGARVSAVDRRGSGFRVHLAGGQTLDARVVIGAWGRWDALDRRLERAFLIRRAHYLGWSGELAGDAALLAGQVRLYMFPGGYCGLSRVEGGRANMAGVVSARTRQRIGGGWETVMAHALASNAALDADLSGLTPGREGFLGTGPVFFTAKPPAESGLLMTGDAAGVLDPFSGQGQAAALGSGLLAGETAAGCLSGEISPSDLPRVYAAAWRARFSRRFAWSKVFRQFMLSPSLGALGARLAGRRLARLALEKLTQQDATAPLPPPA